MDAPGDPLVMGRMTLATVLGLVSLMGVGCRIRVARGAGQICVGRTLLRALIDQWNEFLGNGLGPGP